MRKENFVSSVIAKHRKIAEETEQLDEFFNERFEIFSPNAASCIISGSSIGYPHIEYTEPNLDAAATHFIANTDGVISEIRMATTDGLGDCRTDPSQNEPTRCAAEAVSRLFCTQVPPVVMTHPNVTALRNLVLDVCSKTNESAKVRNQIGNTALAATMMRVSKEGVECSFANVGDTMIVVLDGASLAVKFVVPPRVVAQGFNIWAPLSLQQFRRAVVRGLSTDSVQFKDPNLGIQPGDFILQMTDGAWCELLSTTVFGSSGNEKWMEYQVDTNFLYKIIVDNMKISAETQIPRPIQIAVALIRFTLNRTLEHRLQFNSLFSRIQNYLDITDTSLTVKDWLLTFDDVQLVQELKSYLFDVEHDGINFTENSEAYFVANYLKEYCFGDCTTISVTEVPSWDVELIRALVENPENAIKLLPKIAQELSGRNVKSLIEKLRSERFIPKSTDGIKPNLFNIITHEAYTDFELANAEFLIDAYLMVQRYLENSKFSEIEALYKTLSKSIIGNLHASVINLMQKYQSFTFDNRFLHYNRYRDIKILSARLDALFKERSSQDDYLLVAKL